MPRKPRKPRVVKQIISLALRSYLETGNYQTDTEEAADVFLMELTPKMRTTWDSCRAEIMGEWIQRNPCSRPWAFWKLDSEPRQRLGGTGTPSYEVLAYSRRFERGLPAGWISKRDEDIYNLKGVAINPEDPPYFESEATFLDRHGLLTESEKRYLAKHSKLLKPERIEFEDEKV